jgi:CheY-like chemotaxis protein
MAYILVVEDDADSGNVLVEFLRRAGHEAISLPNGREALGNILKRTPDLIVLDLFMPEMDGAGLLEILRGYLKLQSLPVIVYTGLPDSPAADRARFLKVNAVLVKGRATHLDVVEAVKQELPRAPRAG